MFHKLLKQYVEWRKSHGVRLTALIAGECSITVTLPVTKLP